MMESTTPNGGEPTVLLLRPRSEHVRITHPEGTAVGAYTIGELLSVGGMSAVYEAIDRRDGQRAAIKMPLEPGGASPAAARLTLEAAILHQLDHPHIVRVLDAGLHDRGVPWIAMQLLEGETLAARLTRGPIDPRLAIPLLRQVASALAAAHVLRVVHRDVKPANVFLVGPAEAPHAVLIDWGIARAAGALDRLTARGVAVGTPTYMSPEAVQGLPDISDRADVYALGVVAYELLLGSPPFTADEPLAIAVQHVQRELPAPRERWPMIPEVLDHALRAMLRKVPEARPSLFDVDRQLAAGLQALEERWGPRLDS